MTASHPIACTLSTQGLADRIAWIGALNRDFLRESSLEGASLRLTYDAAAARDVHTLVAREQECCGFLCFSIQDDDDAIVLRIEASASEDMSVAPLFAPFLAGALRP